jgi:hypothetical protein
MRQDKAGFATFSFARAERVGEGGAKRRMRAGALKRDGGATGTMRDGADGTTAPLRSAALIRPSGTLYGAFPVKNFVLER